MSIWYTEILGEKVPQKAQFHSISFPECMQMAQWDFPHKPVIAHKQPEVNFSLWYFSRIPKLSLLMPCTTENMEPLLLSMISLQISNLWCKLASVSRNMIQKIRRLGSLFCWHYNSNSAKTYVLRKCQIWYNTELSGNTEYGNPPSHPAALLKR